MRALFAEATQPGSAVEPKSGARVEGADFGAAWWNDAKPVAVRSGPFKLVRAAYLGYEALFDLSRDPWERQDLSRDPTHAATLSALRTALATYRASGQALTSSFDPAQSLETVRRLEALGYYESGH